MREPRSHEPGREVRQDAGAGLDALDEVVASVLEAEPEARDALLARLDGEDAERARRVRSRLAALGDLGFSLDAPRRAAGLPRAFGRFTRLERAGIGGMGEVHLARDEETGERAAIKLVRPEHLMFETARERFRREIDAIGQLGHPGIVRVLEVGEEEGVPWLALEWVGGASLEQILERLRGAPPEALRPTDFEDAVRAASAGRPHPEPARAGAFPGRTYVEVVARVVARVAQALAHAHAAGVLHRDVKPSNVLVTPSGRVLLSDFGLALPRGADRMTRTGSWLGSLPYAAPEQIEGSPRALDRRADVYSLGATLYELVTLRTPFLGGPEEAVRRRVVTSDLEAPHRLNPALPPAVEAVCLAALDVDPRRRPVGALEMAEDLERALSGKPVRARPAPAWLRLRRWVRRRPGRAASLALVTLVTLGALGFGLRERAVSQRVAQLADAELVRGLVDESAGFWPAAPEDVLPMQGWLERAQAVLARRADHEGALADLEARALDYTDADRARDQAPYRAELSTLAREIEGLAAYVERGDRSRPPEPPVPEVVRARDAEIQVLLAQPADVLVAALNGWIARLRAAAEREAPRWEPDLQQILNFQQTLERGARGLHTRQTYRFDAALDAWRFEALRRLLGDLDQLRAAVPRVRRQLAETERLTALAAGEGAAAWERAVEAIAASPRYGGLRVAPIFGLVPLGEDPASGLWEFLLAASGDAPERDAAAPGGVRVTEATGIVLVLLPGGRYRMGQAADEEPVHFNARPAHEVELAPFLISKHEVSVAQAERLGVLPTDIPRPADGRLPQILDWERARALLALHGLDLPTEAQWEYAARAGGAPWEPLEGSANVNDRTRAASRASTGQGDLQPAAPFDDGFEGAAPVGSFRPNAYGLHDMLGNAAEWCRDSYIVRGYSTLVPRAGDGLRATVVPAVQRAIRGGSFMDRVDLCRPEIRLGDAPGKTTYTTGVRAVRAVTVR